jgi:hypothetical protein
MALARSTEAVGHDDNNLTAKVAGMKWSLETKAEIPQAMRDEIEAEMATKRVLRGGTEEDKMRARAETASLKKKVMDLKVPRNPKMPTPEDIELIGKCPWKHPRETERINKFSYRILAVDPKFDEINPKTGAAFDKEELAEATLKAKNPRKNERIYMHEALCPPPPPTPPPSTPPRMVSALALRPADLRRKEEQSKRALAIQATF